MKKHAKTIRNTAITVAVLLFLLIGVGVGYTWYMGQQPVAVPALVTTDEPVSQVPKHLDASVNVPESVSIQSITTPVAPGSNASVIVKTNPASNCTIVVEYNKVPSKDSGLAPKVSDEYGTLTWAWTVEETVPVGTWPVHITCTRGPKLTAVVIGDLVVAK
jgi:hypothetical protein